MNTSKTIVILILSIIVYTVRPTLAQTSTLSPSQLNKKGAEYGQKGQLNKAARDIRASIALYNQQTASLLHQRGLMLERQGKVAEAIKDYQEAVARNPLQAMSYERLGYWSYRQGEYHKAVELGEKTLKLDPVNKKVREWLVEAYRLKLANPIIEPKKVEPEKKAQQVAKQEEKKQDLLKEAEKKEKEYRFKVSFDAMIRTAYEIEGSNYKYQKSPGLVMNIPYTFSIWARPAPVVEFQLDIGNPYLGASLPNVSGQYERLEAIIDAKFLFFGVGMLLNHYKDDIVFGEELVRNDYKAGFIFGYKTDKAIFSIKSYPHSYALYGGENTDRKTYDVGYSELKYTYILDTFLQYYSRITMADYYFTDHDLEVTNYWGYYEIMIGFTLQRDRVMKGVGVAVNLELGKRVNLEKLQDPDVYGSFNGQGYLGYDKDPEDGERRFSGYKSTSNILNVRVDEFIDNIFFYQKIFIEVVDRHETQHEFALQLGAGILL